MITLTETVEMWLGENGYYIHQESSKQAGRPMWTREEWAKWWRDPRNPDDPPTRRFHPTEILVGIILSAERHGHAV